MSVFTFSFFYFKLNCLQKAISPSDQTSRLAFEKLKRNLAAEKRIMTQDFAEYCGLKNKLSL